MNADGDLIISLNGKRCVLSVPTLDQVVEFEIGCGELSSSGSFTSPALAIEWIVEEIAKQTDAPVDLRWAFSSPVGDWMMEQFLINPLPYGSEELLRQEVHCDDGCSGVAVTLCTPPSAGARNMQLFPSRVHVADQTPVFVLNTAPSTAGQTNARDGKDWVCDQAIHPGGQSDCLGAFHEVTPYFFYADERRWTFESAQWTTFLTIHKTQ